MMLMDALPKLKSFLGIELELGIKIFSLVNIAYYSIQKFKASTYDEIHAWNFWLVDIVQC